MATNIVPGTGKHATVTNPTALAGSVSQNPFSGVEFGRTAAGSKYTTVTSSDPLVPMPVVGGVAGGTFTGDSSVKADGPQTAKATTSSGSGTGATVTYTVSDNEADSLSIANAGSGYQVNEILTVTGDTGVRVKVTSLS